MARLVNDSERCQEKAYWTHFKDQKFVRIFKPENQYRLVIPQKFVGSLSSSFDGVPKVRDPSRIVWEFGLMRRSNAVYFDEGWRKFVAAHSLQENDILIFTYVGQMRFDVLIFESQTSCERVSSYFVDGLDAEDEEKKFGQSSSSDHATQFVPDPVGCMSQCSGLKKVAKRHAIQQPSQETDAFTRAGKRAKESGEAKQVNKENLLTELRKQKALQLAYASAREIWSIYIMRQSYISQGFSMTLATKWAKQYLPSNSQDIVLRTNSQTWGVRFYRKGTGYALTGEWKKFASTMIYKKTMSVFFIWILLHLDLLH